MQRSWLRGWIVAATVASLLSTAPLAITARTASAVDLSSEMHADIAASTQLVAELALIELTNTDRASNGLPPLNFDPELLAIARERAADQLQQDKLSHLDAEGRLAFVKLLDAAGLRYGMAGENLARSGANGPDVTERVEAALMNSPTHRKNILDSSFSRIAIGAAVDASGRIAFAQIFRGD